MAPRICLERGCPNYAWPPKSRCPAHEREHRNTPANRERSTARWQKLRTEWLARHPSCAECDRRQIPLRARGTQLQVDHVVPLSAGGTSVWENLQTLCHRHNNQKKVEDARRYGLGRGTGETDRR